VAKAAADFAMLLPDGIATPHHHFLTAYVDGRVVGMLWLNLVDESIGRHARVYNVVVEPAERGHGYGRAIMLAAEQTSREMGAVSISLNVWGHNHIARNLYESLDYQAVAISMRKPLA